MHLDQPFPGQPPEPGIERQRAASQVVVHGAVGLGEGVLNDIGGVHAAGEPVVQPDGDHLAQPVTVPGEQRLTGRLVTLRHLLDQPLGLR